MWISPLDRDRLQALPAAVPGAQLLLGLAGSVAIAPAGDAWPHHRSRSVVKAGAGATGSCSPDNGDWSKNRLQLGLRPP
uniref:Uncharacterized protein n=1 Tax=Sphaerodactylus townsendi TaxID=933632 RepID=A0ACB8FFH6_9SAUR